MCEEICIFILCNHHKDLFRNDFISNLKRIATSFHTGSAELPPKPVCFIITKYCVLSVIAYKHI